MVSPRTDTPASHSFVVTRAVAIAAVAAASALVATTAASPAAASHRAAPAHVQAAAHAAGPHRHALPHPAEAANPTNPLAGRFWGVYKGNADPAWKPYVHSRGSTHRLLARIALRPKAKWFGRWLTTGDIGQKVREYIDNATAGHRHALVQMTVFDMDPWERAACTQLPTAAERARYKRYISIAAKQIGRTHVALVLQPDGPFAICAPHHSRMYSNLIAWAARTFNALPNTSVYIDMGSADWMRGNVAKAVRILTRAGVGAVRGFAMDVTHFDQVGHEIAFGSRVVNALARHGIAHRHFVIDTADSGRGFTGRWWHAHHAESANFNNAAPCTSRAQHRCVTLGIPPTTDVANPKWGLSAKLSRQAARWVDAYLWISRPWLSANDERFHMYRALNESRTAPYLPKP